MKNKDLVGMETEKYSIKEYKSDFIKYIVVGLFNKKNNKMSFPLGEGEDKVGAEMTEVLKDLGFQF